MKTIVALFVLLSFMVSCKKETVKTPGQVAADQINAALQGTNITDAWIHDDTSPFSSTVKFQVSGQFVIVNVAGSSMKYYYNLERLVKFEIYPPPSGRLDLYFN